MTNQDQRCDTLTAMIGRQINHYQILEALGEGGMGIVYKARDTALNRYVALKVLRADHLTDADRKERFIREARAASRLNHPNIITVHEISREGDSDFIVMEYVAGKTLAALLNGKGLPVGEALRYAVQITDSLSAAHRAGIIHRDLKPANVMVTDRGLVKILDFGLAKLVEHPSQNDETRTAVTGDPLTAKGAILGTVNYMSPEQAQGLVLDSRSDIFSFGSVLYEMLTGRRAFQGETAIDTLAAIIRQEPRAASELTPGLPQEVDRIIGRCLRKDPARRFQHMEDLKVALEEMKEDSDSGKAVPAGVLRPRRRWLRTAVSLVAALLGIAAGVWWLLQGPATTPADPMLTRLTSDSGLTIEPSTSPDGKLIAYASDRAGEGSLDIWIQQIDGGEARRLTTNAADDREPHFSPDGSKVVLSSERDGGGVYVISSLGGMERKIAGRGYRPRFSPNGKEIAYWVGDRAAGGFAPAASAASEVRIVGAEGGPSRKLQGDLASAWMPAWSPDGRHLVMQGLRKPSGAPREGILDWWVVSGSSGNAVATGAMNVILNHKEGQQTFSRDIEMPLGAPDLWLDDQVFCTARLGDSVNIWGLSLSSKDFSVSGIPKRLTGGATADFHPTVWRESGRTRIVFSSQTFNVNIWGLPLDPDRAKPMGSARPLTDNMADDTRPSISADGQLLVYNSNRSGSSDVWLKDLSSGRETPVATSAGHEEGGRLSPDGSEILYTLREGEATSMYLLPTRGGLSSKVTNDCVAFPWAFHSRSTLCWNHDGLWLLDIQAGKRRQITTTLAAACRLSWDDRWMTCYRPAEQPGRSRVLAIPLRESGPTPEQDWVPVTSGQHTDALPEFSPDGTVVYFLSLRDGFGCLWAQRVDSTTKRPVGDPFSIEHFHSARRSPGYLRAGPRAISLARNLLVFTVEERTGNIWMAELGR